MSVTGCILQRVGAAGQGYGFTLCHQTSCSQGTQLRETHPLHPMVLQPPFLNLMFPVMEVLLKTIQVLSQRSILLKNIYRHSLPTQSTFIRGQEKALGVLWTWTMGMSWPKVTRHGGENFWAPHPSQASLLCNLCLPLAPASVSVLQISLVITVMTETCTRVLELPRCLFLPLCIIVLVGYELWYRLFCKLIFLNVKIFFLYFMYLLCLMSQLLLVVTINSFAI